MQKKTTMRGKEHTHRMIKLNTEEWSWLKSEHVRDIKRLWCWCCFVWHVHILKKLTVNTCENVRWEETQKDITGLVSQAFPETTKRAGESVQEKHL